MNNFVGTNFNKIRGDFT